jgi:nucleoid-associated protein YgaU
VIAGDTLWDIAALALNTDDARRIARYWPRIHRANREVLGPDPSLIFPGTVLVLPAEECVGSDDADGSS